MWRFVMIFCLFTSSASAQVESSLLNYKWQFRQVGTKRWYKASVPGSVYTDLLHNQRIPDPFFNTNETAVQWVDTVNWEYQAVFDADAITLARQHILLQFDGLDTYADVYLNGKLILSANNMFRQWETNIRSLLRLKNNSLRVLFTAARKKTDSIARAALPLVLPDNNRVYARKAQFQFGWDWGPKLIGCGIWHPVWLVSWNGSKISPVAEQVHSTVKLIQQKDSTGRSFYFEKDGHPVYIKGANWIPADIFLNRIEHTDYRRLLEMAKTAGINMLRVWGGGIYENDYFYTLCDQMGIMVWQDFMFAGAMYPGDNNFFSNVKEEIRYQVTRLKAHPCIVLWCGNNEIDEAWHNWDWQEQFNIHGADSVTLWHNYTRLFEDSLKQWVNEFDGSRPYIPSSPKFGWGNEKSLLEGDSHYWGLWWGLEDWEIFKTKTGRFVSEYGMQAMPDYQTIREYTTDPGRFVASGAIQSHQKANEGFKKLNYYLNRYIIDTTKLSTISLEQYTYLTQCLQYYILKNSILTQMSKRPVNMGTLLWQLNDCWPGTSWSIIDHYKRPKAGYYAVKAAYTDNSTEKIDSIYPKDLSLQRPNFIVKRVAGTKNSFIIKADQFAKYVYLNCPGVNVTFSDNYFDLQASQEKRVTVIYGDIGLIPPSKISVTSFFDIK